MIMLDIHHCFTYLVALFRRTYALKALHFT